MNKIKENVIPKEDAVFWLDKHGRWCNANGKFEHQKIIDYFHSCIKRDQGGYYLSQINGNCREKVYFPYEDQALFVFDVIRQDDMMLILNTKKQIALDPEPGLHTLTLVDENGERLEQTFMVLSKDDRN